jgi:hypothetical protein
LGAPVGCRLSAVSAVAEHAGSGTDVPLWAGVIGCTVASSGELWERWSLGRDAVLEASCGQLCWPTSLLR